MTTLMIPTSREQLGKNHEPRGLKFYSQQRRQDMLLVQDAEHPFNWWICFKHADGQWVSLRRATAQDVRDINLAIAEAQRQIVEATR